MPCAGALFLPLSSYQRVECSHSFPSRFYYPLLVLCSNRGSFNFNRSSELAYRPHCFSRIVFAASISLLYLYYRYRSFFSLQTMHGSISHLHHHHSCFRHIFSTSSIINFFSLSSDLLTRQSVSISSKRDETLPGALSILLLENLKDFLFQRNDYQKKRTDFSKLPCCNISGLKSSTEPSLTTEHVAKSVLYLSRNISQP